MMSGLRNRDNCPKNWFHYQSPEKFQQFFQNRMAKIKPGPMLQSLLLFTCLRLEFGRIRDRVQYDECICCVQIHPVQTANDHEFQAKFHCQLENLGIRHVYMNPYSPRLNGKVECPHGTDNFEFYQLLTYTDDVDLNRKSGTREGFYNFN
jgi:transposase InsO family protein